MEGVQCSVKDGKTKDRIHGVYSMSVSKCDCVAIAITTWYGEALDVGFIFSLFITMVFVPSI